MADLTMMSQSRLLMGFVCFHRLTLYALEAWAGSSPVERCWHRAGDRTPAEIPAPPQAQPIQIARVVATGNGTAAVVALDVPNAAVVGIAQVGAESVSPGTNEVVSVGVANEAAPAGAGWRVRSSPLGSFVSLHSDSRYRARG